MTQVENSGFEIKTTNTLGSITPLLSSGSTTTGSPTRTTDQIVRREVVRGLGVFLHEGDFEGRRVFGVPADVV